MKKRLIVSIAYFVDTSDRAAEKFFFVVIEVHFFTSSKIRNEYNVFPAEIEIHISKNVV